MAQNSQPVQLVDVLKFFVIEIDGMGIKTGNIRNLGAPAWLEKLHDWKLLDLTIDEFRGLIIPDETKELIGERVVNNDFSKDLLDKLNAGTELPRLILREKLPSDRQDASYYIEDGAHRAIALKFYFDTHDYKIVRAYVGKL